MKTYKISGKEISLPYIFPRSDGKVRIYGEPAAEPTRFRLRWQKGRDANGHIVYDHLMRDTLSEALAEGKNKVDLVKADERPRDPDNWEKTQNEANLYRACSESLKDSGFTVVTACSLVGELVKDLGPEGLKTYVHVYGPRLAKAHDKLVEDVVPDFRKSIFKNEKHEPVTAHQTRKADCLESFVEYFKGRMIGTIMVSELTTFLELKQSHIGGQNTWLYCLRELFRFARDIKKALPALLPTECDLVVYHAQGKANKAVFSVKSYAMLGAAAPDRETLLALLLVCRHHTRSEECCKLKGEDFRRDAKGLPIELGIRADVSKTKIPRTIPIPEEHRATLNELVPDRGPLFTSKDPFGRIRRLAKRLEIKWVRGGQRHSCTSYSVYSGVDIKDVAKWNGHTEEILRRHYLVEVPHSESKTYCSIRFSLSKIKLLPKYRDGRKNSRKRKINTPAAALKAAA